MRVGGKPATGEPSLLKSTLGALQGRLNISHSRFCLLIFTEQQMTALTSAQGVRPHNDVICVFQQPVYNYYLDLET